METANELVRKSCGFKRKRSRTSKLSPEEDVCFVCYDAGYLVVCDQMNCHKAYHPACANVEQGVLGTRESWNCSRHVCYKCQKTAYYSCYTCTYSLCKWCMRELKPLHVRGNKGFCRNCMPIVKFIEKNKAQVDFNDRNSREGRLRDYWIDLRSKLSFTSEELAQAINRFKRSVVLVCKEELAGQLDDANAEQDTIIRSSSKCCAVLGSKRRKTNRCSNSFTQKDCSIGGKVGGEDSMSLQCDAEWACDELLDFVSYMRDGDTSVLSIFDVKALLFQYIKQNNLRDPNNECQILCDRRLENLFGKRCIGHFEMLRRLSSHLIKKGTREDYAQMRLFDANISQMESRDHTESPRKLFTDKLSKTRRGEYTFPETNNDDYNASDVDIDIKDDSDLLVKASAGTRLETCSMDEHMLPLTNLYDIAYGIQGYNSTSLLIESAYKKFKLLKRGEHRSLQTHLDNYVAIDVNTIKLLFLRRNVLEDLLVDADKFHDKVLGSFVRVSDDSSQKQEMHRLVQVVDTRRAPYKYTTGEKTTDFMLKISTLSKTKIIQISSVSNEEFSMDECKCLCESIKSGSVRQMTVGKFLEKATALQEARFKDSSFLEERLHRIQEILEIHTDLNIGPNSVSGQDAVSDDKRSDDYMMLRDTTFNSKGRKPIPPKRGGPILKNTGSTERKNSLKALEPRRNMIAIESTWDQERDNYKTDSWRKGRKQVSASILDNKISNGQVVGSSQSSESVSASFGIHTDKLWHYQDPSGKIQGPFSILQLLKWSSIASFPANLRVWRTMEKQEESILLCDALNNSLSHSPSVKATYADKRVNDTSDLDACTNVHNSQLSPSSLVSAKSIEHQIKSGEVSSSLDPGTCNGQVVVISQSAPASLENDIIRLWHYQDPSGYVQGPFSMLQFLKWSATSSFPANLRVWRTTEKQEDSILLIDALNNSFSHPAYKDKRVNDTSDSDAGAFPPSNTSALVSTNLTKGLYGGSAAGMSETNTSSRFFSQTVLSGGKITDLNDKSSLMLVENGVTDSVQNSSKDLSRSGNDSSQKADSSKVTQTSPAVSAEMTSESTLTGVTHVLHPQTMSRAGVDGETRPHEISVSMSGETQDSVAGSTHLKASFPAFEEKGVKECLVQDSKIDLSSSEHGLRQNSDAAITTVSQEMTYQSTCRSNSKSEVDGKTRPPEILASMSVEIQGSATGTTSSNEQPLQAPVVKIEDLNEEPKSDVSSSQHRSIPKVETGDFTVASSVVSAEMSFQSLGADDPPLLPRPSWHEMLLSSGYVGNSDSGHNKAVQWGGQSAASVGGGSRGGRLCKFHQMTPRGCKYGNYCSFIHDDNGENQNWRKSWSSQYVKQQF